MTAVWLLDHEPAVRGAAFVLTATVLMLAERAVPCRGDARPARRQAVNLGLVVLGTALLRLVFPLLTVAFAVRVAAAGGGLLRVAALSPALATMLAVLGLDLAIYAQHRLLHTIPIFWRVHRVHHSDVAFDASLGLRFHPFEIALSQLVKFATVALLGAPPIAVLLFEVWLQAGALFSHADLALPPPFDRRVRWLLVTPSMHRVHHSVEPDETDSNFGFNLVWWDRLFGTYRAAARRGEATMPIGLDAFRAAADQGLLALLAQPFRPAPALARPAPEAPRA